MFLKKEKKANINKRLEEPFKYRGCPTPPRSIVQREGKETVVISQLPHLDLHN